MAGTDKTAADSAISGYVEGVTERTLSGWAYDATAPDRPLEMELLVDGQVRAVFLAEIDRPDVQDAGHPALTCGFSLTLPRDVPAGKKVSLTVRAKASGTVIEGGALRVRLPEPAPEEKLPEIAPAAPAAPEEPPFPLAGGVEQIDTGGIIGWVQDPADPGRAVDLCILVDGEVAGMAVADQPRQDVQEAGHARLNCGFRVALPEAALDGRKHRIRVIDNDSNRMLPGGEVELAASFEGVAFLRPGAGVIAGWARPGRHVRLRFGDAPPVTVPLDRPVAGFLADNICGFECPVPEALRDGAWHQVSVEHPGSGAPLDGSPLNIRLAPSGLPQVVETAMLGRRFHGSIVDDRGLPLQIDLAVETGGRRLLETRSDHARTDPSPDDEPRPSNRFSFPVPHGVTELSLLELLADGTSRRLATCAITEAGEGEVIPSLAQEISDRTLSDPERLATIRARFEAFCKDPGTLFDPVWYGLAHMGRSDTDTDPTEALQHYASAGHAAGASPLPAFDEAGTRRAFPAIDRAIKAGRVPCAFAVWLHLGEGVLPLAGTEADAAAGTMTPAPEVHVARLGLPTAGREPATSVYAAWLARLGLEPETRLALEEDEARARAFIRSHPLTRKPLVSIIMPTYNRAYTIGDAIQSALDQGYDNFELLICDDASDDKTPEVIKQFDDPRIRYFQFAKSNGAGTRNKGLRFARGEIIAYLDSDNLWNPHFLDLMLRKLLQDPGTQIAFSGYLDTVTVGSRVDLEAISHPVFNPVALSHKNFMDLNTIVHHRRVYDWLGGFDGELPRLQDWDLMLRYTSVFRPVAVDHAMVYYRRNVAWGQVTHLHMGGNAQNLVNAKTRARLEESHVTLDLDWPARERLTLICAKASDLPAAEALGGLAAAYADVEIVSGTAPAGPLPEGVSHDAELSGLLATPERLAYLLSVLQGGHAVIWIGDDAPALPALRRALPSDQLFRLELGSAGLALRSVQGPPVHFHLGALPVPALAGVTAAARRDLLVVLLGAGEAPSAEEIAAQVRPRGFEALVAPAADGEGWTRITADRIETTAPGRDASAEAVSRAALALVLAPRSALPMASFGLLTALQAAAVPLALRPGPLSDELISTRCAYPLEQDRLSWIFEKTTKLLNSDKDTERLSKASRTAYRIAEHPELAQQRLAVFLQLVATGAVRPEVHLND